MAEIPDVAMDDMADRPRWESDVAMAEGSRLMNVYVVDAQGRVHDVAYDLHADDAKRMAKSIEGGVAALERPAEKKPAKASS